MDTEKCKIKLNSPENIYFSGQEIKGQITLNLAKKTRIQGIKFCITGKGKVYWYELIRRESHPTTIDKGQRSIIYSAKENYLTNELYILGSSNSRPIDLSAGEHTYDFNYNLYPNIPSTFLGNHGSIKYKIKFIIIKPWTFNDKYSLPITIVKLSNLSLATLASLSNHYYQVTKNIGMYMFGGGPITLAAELPCSFVVRGEKLKLRVNVDNKSNTHIDRCKFSIKQIVTYISQVPLCILKEQITKIFKKETGGIQKKTSRDYEHELQVPYCQPTDNDCSHIIHIKYEVQVEVVLPGLYKNLSLALPFTVCSVSELENNANETSSSDIGWNSSYPNPNISIYSDSNIGDLSINSPSHSSTADNASLYSTSSSNSFHRSDRGSSIRNSFRHSQFISNEISLSSSAPQYPSDLPPSYEELYGNSSQSLPTAPSPSSPVRK